MSVAVRMIAEQLMKVDETGGLVRDAIAKFCAVSLQRSEKEQHFCLVSRLHWGGTATGFCRLHEAFAKRCSLAVELRQIRLVGLSRNPSSSQPPCGTR